MCSLFKFSNCRTLGINSQILRLKHYKTIKFAGKDLNVNVNFFTDSLSILGCFELFFWVKDEPFRKCFLLCFYIDFQILAMSFSFLLCRQILTVLHLFYEFFIPFMNLSSKRFSSGSNVGGVLPLLSGCTYILELNYLYNNSLILLGKVNCVDHKMPIQHG